MPLLNKPTSLGAKHEFAFCADLAPPQIPFVEDVLYAMRETNQPRFFHMAKRDSPTYIANIGLVMVEAAEEFRKVRPSGTPSLETAISRLIYNMCPDEARCLFVPAYVEATTRIGLLKVDLEGKSLREINEICGCRRCREPLREL